MHDENKAHEPSGELSLSSDAFETNAQKAFDRKQSVTPFVYPLSSRKVVVPAIEEANFPGRRIVMTGSCTPDKDVLYKLIVAAYNYAFTDKFASISAKCVFSQNSHLFVEWLNEFQIRNRFEILKEYEAYRFDFLNSHGGESVLLKIKTIFTHALEYSCELTDALTPSELDFLFELKKTKISPNLNKAQLSLSNYFGALDWLRSDNKRIGSKHYSALYSPKHTIQSLILTASTIIIEFSQCKRELRCLFKDNEIDIEFFSIPARGDKQSTRNYYYEKSKFIGRAIFKLLSAYHKVKEPSDSLKLAIELLLFSNASCKQSFNAIKPALDSQHQCDLIFLSEDKKLKTEMFNCTLLGEGFTSRESGHLFSFALLKEIVSGNIYYPISPIENLMFSWLMSSLTVQPSDIPKLRHNSFRLLKIGGKVKHIECEYFKGRAKVFHTTRSLSSSEIGGRALLSYLTQVPDGNPLASIIKNLPRIQSGHRALTGNLMVALQMDFLKKRLIEEHKKSGGMPLLIPRALISLIAHGTHIQNIRNANKLTHQEKESVVYNSDRVCSIALFGLQAIKNSAVYAFSDPFTLEYLINRNSHSNKTEKVNYYNEENEVWLNSCGRITREVMFDLINNVYNLRLNGVGGDENKRALLQFNKEFMAVSSSISYRSREMMCRLKVVTNQKKGKINEVGVLSLNQDRDEQDFEPIYVLDSPLTAWKMLNYLHEFKKHYKKLLSRNPEYLFQTAFPTVEWIEHTLNKLSKANKQAGYQRFKEMVKNGVEVSVFHSI